MNTLTPFNAAIEATQLKLNEVSEQLKHAESDLKLAESYWKNVFQTVAEQIYFENIVSNENIEKDRRANAQSRVIENKEKSRKLDSLNKDELVYAVDNLTIQHNQLKLELVHLKAMSHSIQKINKIHVNRAIKMTGCTKLSKTIGSTNAQKVGIYLRDIRKEKGHTMHSLAKVLGTTHSFVGKVEKSDRRIDVIEFITYCKSIPIDPVEAFTKLYNEVLRDNYENIREPSHKKANISKVKVEIT